MKKHLALTIILALSLSAYSQEIDSQPFKRKNSIQVDLGGHGLFYSLNYERILLNGERFKTAIQAGISYYPPGTGIRDVWMPLGVNELVSFGNHHLEAGLGYMPIREAIRTEGQADEWFWSHMMTGRVGYRFQKPEGRWIVRAAFTPVLEIDRSGHGDEFHPLGGISVGFCF